MPLNTTDAPANASPLWIIALFIALSEAMAGVASIETDGATRFVFAVFAVSFPVLVFVVFILMLLRHPANLYAPSQYNAQTTIESYAKTLQRERHASTVVIEHAIAEAISRATAEFRATGSPPTDAELRAKVATTLSQAIDEGTVTIDASPLVKDADPIQVPITDKTTVDDLLDSVYFSIRPTVEPFTYNKSWVLANADLTPLKDIGTLWARGQGSKRDSRTLVEAGIDPASKLIVLPKH